MRLFVAAEIPPAVATAAARAIGDLSSRFRSVRWEDPAKYHFTLKFLGEVAPGAVAVVTEGVARSSLHMGPFEANLRGLGFFPPGRRPRVVWIGVEKGAEELKRLASEVERELRSLGFEPERRAFEPHLTVGRVKGFGEGPRLAEALARRDAEPLGDPFRVERVALFESRLMPGGSRYSLVHASALGGDSGMVGG